MAFSTQKDFFNVPFMNESYGLDCKKACVKLKSYESTDDTRAWASDETKQSNFLIDLVTCQYPSTLALAEGEIVLSSTDNQKTQSQRNMQSNADVNFPKGASTSKYTGETKTRKQSDYNAEELGLQLGGDSLLECANVHLAEYQKILKINSTLEKQLEVSKERLKTANEENKQIREILSNKLDSNTAKDFYNKIQKFTAAGKFNKNEENIMLEIYQKMINMNKAYEILQAENNYLKRLIEKLTARVTLENITTEPEQSEDIVYLQNEINSLRKECILLRQIEDDYQKLEQQQVNKSVSISEQDAENIKTIIKERNSLREKCKSFKTLEQHVKELEHKTQEAKNEVVDLSSCLKNKTHYINEMEREMENMQKYYEDKYQNACLKEDCLKAQLTSLKHEFIKAKCEAQKAEILCMEVSSLQNEVLKRDLSLNDYDCQYKQLMDVVNELQSVKFQSLHDNQTQTCIDQADEVTFYTRATLNQIMKELKKRGGLIDEYPKVYRLEPAPGGTNAEYDIQCCQEMKRLQQELDEMKIRMQETINCENLCADAHKRLTELESENAKLVQDNQILSGKLKEADEKMMHMLQKITNLDKDISRNSQETNKFGKDLQGTIDLVKDISEVQLKNQQLANAVSVINSRDDEKIIEDLRRQLEEEMGNLKKCQQHNTNLLEEAQLREIDFKELKELNNSLLYDNANLKKILNLTQSEDIGEIFDVTKEKTELEKDNLGGNTKKVFNEEKKQVNRAPSTEAMSTNPKRTQQEDLDLDEFVTNRNRRQIMQEVADLDELETSQYGANKHQTANQKEPEFVRSPPNTAVNKHLGQIQQEAADLYELITSPSKEDISKTPSRLKQKVVDVDEFVHQSRTQQEVVDLNDFLTSPFNNAANKQPSRIKHKVSSLDDFVISPSNDVANKNLTRTQQEVEDLDELVTSPPKDFASKQPKRAQKKIADLDEFKISTSKDAAIKQIKYAQQKGKVLEDSRLDASNKQLTRDHQKPKVLSEYEPSMRKDLTNKKLSRDQQKDAALDDFVSKKSDNLKHNLQKGRCFEKEFRNILEEFIFECSSCFCRSFNIKSKLYDICHRLCHNGIDTLTFRELAYLHKKIYAQADQLIPGCLLDMILTDHKEQIERMLTSVEMSHSVDNKEIYCKISDGTISSVDQKCCCCKNELCCNYSEEMLKDKVNKLEKDIGIAREYLETLRNIPVETNVALNNCDSSNSNNSTYRASSPVMILQKSRYSKHLKKIKSRMLKHPAI